MLLRDLIVLYLLAESRCMKSSKAATTSETDTTHTYSN